MVFFSYFHNSIFFPHKFQTLADERLIEILLSIHNNYWIFQYYRIVVIKNNIAISILKNEYSIKYATNKFLIDYWHKVFHCYSLAMCTILRDCIAFIMPRIWYHFNEYCNSWIFDNYIAYKTCSFCILQ